MLSKNKFAEDGGRLPFAGQLNQAKRCAFLPALRCGRD